jgi:putative sterol carrier protein
MGASNSKAKTREQLIDELQKLTIMVYSGCEQQRYLDNIQYYNRKELENGVDELFQKYLEMETKKKLEAEIVLNRQKRIAEEAWDAELDVYKQTHKESFQALLDLIMKYPAYEKRTWHTLMVSDKYRIHISKDV